MILLLDLDLLTIQQGLQSHVYILCKFSLKFLKLNKEIHVNGKHGIPINKMYEFSIDINFIYLILYREILMSKVAAVVWMQMNL